MAALAPSGSNVLEVNTETFGDDLPGKINDKEKDPVDTSEDKIQKKKRGKGSKRQKSQRKDTRTRTHIKEEEREVKEDVDGLVAKKIAAKNLGKSFTKRQSQRRLDTSNVGKGMIDCFMSQ